MTIVGCSRAVVTRCADGGSRKCGIEHDPQRLAIFETRQPHRQAWIVGKRRADTDHHGVVQRPQHLHAAVRGFARDLEAWRPGRARGEAVRRLGQFERHHRPAMGDAQDMAEIGAPRCIGSTPVSTSMPAARRRAMAPPGNARIGILERRYDACNARRDDCIGAGRRPAVMAAGLKRDVKRRAARRFARVRAAPEPRHAAGRPAPSRRARRRPRP